MIQRREDSEVHDHLPAYESRRRPAAAGRSYPYRRPSYLSSESVLFLPYVYGKTAFLVCPFFPFESKSSVRQAVCGSEVVDVDSCVGFGLVPYPSSEGVCGIAVALAVGSLLKWVF